MNLMYKWEMEKLKVSEIYEGKISKKKLLLNIKKIFFRISYQNGRKIHSAAKSHRRLFFRY